MTTFSVVIPTYNRREYLNSCLESVAAQRYPPHEVILVDDGSTDGTREDHADRNDVTFVRQDNSGPGAARNRGAAVASGEYIAFLDSDDLWSPMSLLVMSQVIETYRQPSLIFARFENFTGSAPTFPEEALLARFYSDFLAVAPTPAFAGAGMMVVRRKFFCEAGGFAEDRSNGEDHDLALRLGTAPGFVQLAGPTTVARRRHARNEMDDIDKTISGINRLIQNENLRVYPGGTDRAPARQALISQHLRPVVLAAARAGRVAAARELYLASFSWHLTAGRLRFLLAAPALLLWTAIRSRH